MTFTELVQLHRDAVQYIYRLEQPTRNRKGITKVGLVLTFEKLINADPKITKAQLIERAAVDYDVEPKTIYERVRAFGIELNL